MKKIIITLLFLSAINFANAQEENSAYFQDALELTRLSNDAVQVALQPVYDLIPKENLKNFKTELSPIMEKYYKKVAKTYADVYTHDDIKSLLKFYKTDLGQSLLKGQSEIMKKTMAMAQSLSNQIMPVVQKYSK